MKSNWNLYMLSCIRVLSTHKSTALTTESLTYVIQCMSKECLWLYTDNFVCLAEGPLPYVNSLSLCHVIHSSLWNVEVLQPMHFGLLEISDMSIMVWQIFKTMQDSNRGRLAERSKIARERETWGNIGHALPRNENRLMSLHHQCGLLVENPNAHAHRNCHCNPVTSVTLHACHVTPCGWISLKETRWRFARW